jgi:putative ABC transport system permease protein
VIASVNERFAQRFFPGEDAVGHRIRLASIRPPASNAAVTPSPWLTIVGVSPTIRQGDPQALEPDAVVYEPYRRASYGSMALLVRADGDPVALTSAVRQAVQAADPDQPVYSVRSLNEALEQARWPFRVFGSMFAIFAFVALVLSAVGIYAVTSYAVTQRTSEIGVRMALGAQPGQVWWMIMKQGLVQLAIGLTIGLLLALPLSPVLQAVIVQIPARDPVTFSVIAVLLSAVMLLACIVPARRATRLDPLAALRVD